MRGKLRQLGLKPLGMASLAKNLVLLLRHASTVRSVWRETVRQRAPLKFFSLGLKSKM